MKFILITTRHYLSSDGKKVTITQKKVKLFGITLVTREYHYPELDEYNLINMY